MKTKLFVIATVAFAALPVFAGDIPRHVPDISPAGTGALLTMACGTLAMFKFKRRSK